MRTFVSDMDGVLLNTSQAFATTWTDILGVPVKPTDFNSWKHEWALGIDPKLNDEFWGRVWEEPSYPYKGAESFIKSVKGMGYRFAILTSRPSSAAQKAMTRDLHPLSYLVDELLVCNQRNGDKKSSFINAMEDPWFFLDDHIKNVVDAKLNCPKLKDVMIFGGDLRPWNTSLDILGYRRITCYEDVLVRLIQEGQ